MTIFAAVPIPAADPIALPGPIWLFESLLMSTFFLHLVAMNLLLGGSLTSAIAAIGAGKPVRGGLYAKLYSQMVAMLPTLVAATVTLGVAPLLFVQVMYGHFVYTSSIAIGWFWWLVIPLLIIAYYTLYRMKFHSSEGGKPGKATAWSVFLVLLWISFIFSNNFNLSAQPQRFGQMALDDASGWNLNLSDPATFPRWLHMVLGAIAIAGVWLMWLGRASMGRDEVYARFQANFGFGMFFWATLINIFDGFVFMMTLPKDVMMLMMGQGLTETLLWFVGLLAAVGALMALKKSSKNPASPALTVGTVHILVTLVTMVILRHRIRTAYQADYFQIATSAVEPMWGAMAMFGVAFVIGLIVLRWLVVQYRRSG